MQFPATFLILYRFVEPGFSPVLVGTNLPILVQVMVMAVWLIVKGLNPAAIASFPEKKKIVC
jgi:hypothetical protein